MVELLEGRLQMYTTAAENARAAGDTSKQRRLDRGAKVCSSPTDLLIYMYTKLKFGGRGVVGKF